VPTGGVTQRTRRRRCPGRRWRELSADLDAGARASSRDLDLRDRVRGRELGGPRRSRVDLAWGGIRLGLGRGLWSGLGLG
jgi:hypothetical protein